MTNFAALTGYLGGLQIAQGRHHGQPFTLLPWERRFLRGAFRGPGDAALTMARGNGKTTFVAGIACAALDGPLAEQMAESLVVASSFEQGLIPFRHIMAFMWPKFERDGIGPRGRWRIQDSSNRASITDRRTGTMLRVLGSDPRRLHGAAPKLLLLDEVAQWPRERVEPMLSALRTSRGKIPDSRALWIGTRPAVSEHPFAKALAGGVTYAQTHAAKADDPPFRRRTWRKANPSLDRMPDLEQIIRSEAAEAKQDPGALASFLALRLNLGVGDTQERGILDPGVWEGIEVGALHPRGRYSLGLDLGTSAAMSGAAAYWPDSGSLDAFAVFPELPSLEERGLRDGVGRLYVDMAGRNELLQRGRRVSDLRELLREVIGRWGAPSVIATDRWREAELREVLEAVRFPRCALAVRGQGYKDGGEDVREFRRAALDGRCHPIRSLLLRAAMAEARVSVDPAGNEKLAKGREGWRRANARDDAAAAAILAVAEGSRRRAAKPNSGLRYQVIG